MIQTRKNYSWKKTKLWIALTLAIFISACSGSGQNRLQTPVVETPVPTDSTPAQITPANGDTERGAVLFMTKQGHLPSCSTCHSTGHNVIVGPGLGGLSALADQRVSGQSAVEYVHTSILDPGAFVVSGFENIMPSAYGRMLSEQDIADLTAYLLTLS